MPAGGRTAAQLGSSSGSAMGTQQTELGRCQGRQPSRHPAEAAGPGHTLPGYLVSQAHSISQSLPSPGKEGVTSALTKRALKPRRGSGIGRACVLLRAGSWGTGWLTGNNSGRQAGDVGSGHCPCINSPCVPRPIDQSLCTLGAPAPIK